MRKLPQQNPQNRFAQSIVDWDEFGSPDAQLTIHEEIAKEIISENKSPDLGFRYSINPYRGCQHACSYCYARPTHQYLGHGAGTDFDRILVAKTNAADALRAHFDRPSWLGELIVFSGNTDCYQPIEKHYQLTRKCLEVMRDYRNPVAIITKSALIRRDIDLLTDMAKQSHVRVTISIPFADEEVARTIEPYASSIKNRFATIRALTDAQISVGINISPLIVGLNDVDVPELVERAHDAGASHAAMVPLRLSPEVASVFFERLAIAYPNRVEKVRSGLMQIRNGRVTDGSFFGRMEGKGPRWTVVQQLFALHCKRFGLVQHEETDFTQPEVGSAPTTFRRPTAQQTLF